MAVHAYHETLNGFDSRQIWHDGCEECEFRSRNVPSSIGFLDDNNFMRALRRTTQWKKENFELTGEISQAELPLLKFLEMFLLVKERFDQLLL